MVSEKNKNRYLKIILIGQLSSYFGWCILTIRHFLLDAVDSYGYLTLVLFIGFLPSYLYVYFYQRGRPVSYIMVLNALIVVSIAFVSIKDWALASLFILIPVFSLLFRDKLVYILACIASLTIDFLLLYWMYPFFNDSSQLVLHIDHWTVFLIFVFLVYFIVKDLTQISQSETKHLQTILALTKSVEAKDMYTYGHSDRVALLARRIAEWMKGIDPMIAFESGLIHDVGKLAISDTILLKKGALTDEEFNIMKKHPVEGATLCRGLDIQENLIKGVNYHHERWDGRGYPEGLAAEDIPLIGRILCISDAIDAMASNRSYRQSLEYSHIKNEIERGSGTQFDPVIAKLVLAHWDEVIELLTQEEGST